MMLTMILTYCYRINPSPEQEVLMNHTLELLRRHWNYSLGQRLDYLRRTRSQVDRCSIVSEPIGDIPERVNYYTQQSDLKQMKVLFPEYRQIWAESQQVNLQRLNKAWERWLIPDASGKRGGRPRFKQPGELRSFVYPRINSLKAGAHFSCRTFYVGKPDERAPLIDGVLKLSKIGQMKVVVHRPLPDGFVVKTCTIVRKADGWYCCISMQDASVPSTIPLAEIKSAVGADVGLKEFLTTNEGVAVPIPQFYRKAQGKLARQQRKLARKHKGSSHYLKQQNRIARIHQQIGRQRQNCTRSS
jgi:putative transposase